MERQRAEVLAADLNDIVCAARETETPVSCFYGYYASDSGVLNYCNAGHQAPLLVRTHPHQVVRLKNGGPALGAELTPRYSGGSLQLRPGDRLIAFTRGVSDAWARAEDVTGEATLATMLKDWREERAADMAQRIIGEAPEHAFEQRNERVVFVATVRNAPDNSPRAQRAAMAQCAGAI
jgi:sigma-B regulation protein RsbU (phosphoserine phosphatase)